MNCKECGSPFYEDEHVYPHKNEGWVCLDCFNRQIIETFCDHEKIEFIKFIDREVGADVLAEAIATSPILWKLWREGAIGNEHDLIASETEDWEKEQACYEVAKSYKGAS